MSAQERQAETEANDMSKAPAFDPKKDHIEVHAHKRFKYSQNGVYYDAQGNAVARTAKPPKVRRGVAALKAAGGKKDPAAEQIAAAAQRNTGEVPQSVLDARAEDKRALNAEDDLL